MRVCPVDGRLGRALCVFLAAALLGSTTGCSAWNHKAPPKAGFISKPTQLARITLEDQSKVQVYGLRVDGDTLRFWPRKGAVLAADSLRTVPAMRMVGYEEKHFEPAATVFMVGAIAGCLYVAFLFLLD